MTPTPPPNLPAEGFWLLALGLAVVGSIARTLADAIKKGKRPSWFVLGGNAFIAGFCGVLTLFVCHKLGLGQAETGFFSGMAGWLGVDGLALAAAWIKKKIPQ